VSVLGGTICVTVGEAGAVVTITVVGTVTVFAWGGGACDVSVGVVDVVRVAVERVGMVGTVPVAVRVPVAALLPPPHDESAKPPRAISIPAVATLTGCVRCQAPLARRYTSLSSHEGLR
jgi:hypothetical protein